MTHTHIYKGEGASDATWLDSKQVFELGHTHVTRRPRRIATYQWLRQVGDHEAKLHNTQQNLGMGKKKREFDKRTRGFVAGSRHSEL